MSRFRLPFTTPRQLREDIDDELAFHLATSAEAHERLGLNPAEARARAEARLGDVGRLHRALYRIDHRTIREQRMTTWLHDLRHDLAFSLRRLRHRPLLFALILVTLAIGTGSVMTFFGAADRILLRPLPVAEPDRVVIIQRAPASAPESRTGMATGTFMDLAESSRSFAAMAAAEPYGYDLQQPEGPAIAIGAWRVTEQYFAVLPVQPTAGRLLQPTDFVPGGPAAVVVSHDFWRSRLGGDPAAIGRTIHLDGDPWTVVGVLPRDFPVAEGRGLFTPILIRGEAREDRVADYFRAYGRLRPGVPHAAALQEMRELAARSDARHPTTPPARGLHLTPLGDHLLGSVRTGLGLLAVGAILLLVMTAANAAGLLVADTLDRHRELSLRASLGAGRGRIIRQLLTESAALAVAAGVAGFGLGLLGLRAFQRWAPADLPRLAELGLDLRLVLLVTAAVLLLALTIGLLPARLVAGSDLHATLKGDGAAGQGRTGRRARLLLAGTQVALASTLLGAGGLLLRSWWTLQAEDQGYQAAGVVGIEQHVWGSFPTPAARATFGREAVAHLAAEPGVLAAAVVSDLPLAPQIGAAQGRMQRQDTGETLALRAVAGSPELFETLRIPVMAGRAFGTDDNENAEPVVVVSRTAAAALFPGVDPIGRTVQVSFSGPPRPRRIIGIVGDVRAGSPTEPSSPAIYLPHAQAPGGSLYLVTRHAITTPATLIAAQEAALAVVPGGAVEGAVDLGALLAAASAPRRFAMLLLTAFAGVALCLSAIGLFGLLAQGVRARRQELGVRLALGAWPGALRGMVVGQGLRLTTIGLAAGLVLLLLASGLLRRVLYGVPVHDPITLVGVVVVVLAVALFASWWPARQATRVDPIEVLRRE